MTPSLFDDLDDARPEPSTRTPSPEASASAPAPLAPPVGEDLGPTAPADPDRQSGEVPPFEYWATPVEPGRTLVEASAGTGKTFAIAGLVLRLVLDGDWLAASPGGMPDLRRLLVVTFTRAATDELRTRIRRALRVALAVSRGEPIAETSPLAGDLPLIDPLRPLLDRPGAQDRLLAALDRVDEAGVFTIHSFCQRVLKEAAFESGTPFEMDFVEDSDSDALRTRAAADAWARLVHGDGLLAALAVTRGVLPDALLQHHRNTADFPSIRIVPDAPSFDDARSALQSAMDALVGAWQPDAVRQSLDGVEWNKNAPLDGPEGRVRIDRIGALAQGTDLDALGLVTACTPEAVYKTMRKSGTAARKQEIKEIAHSTPFQACADVADAANALVRAFTREFVLEVTRRIEAIKERRGQLTFNDLITRLHDALTSDDAGPTLAAGIRRQFAVALIDEFQDTDPLQYGIFRTAFEGQPLYFVGDPKQAIYAFRGADVHAYLGAQREATRRYTLGTNWRSTARLVDAVNRVFAGPERAFLFDGIPFRPVASAPSNAQPTLLDGDLPPLVWWPMPSNSDEPPGKGVANDLIPPIVAAEIRRLLVEGQIVDQGEPRPLRASDIAVLAPSKFEIRAIQEALQALGIPAVVSKAHDVRESAQMADVELVLRAVLRPDDTRTLRAALATETWGWSASQIADLDDAPAESAALAARLRQWQAAWRRHGVLHVLTDLQQREGVLERMLAYPDGERRVTNLRHAAELLHEVEGDRSPEDLLHWIRHRADQALPSREMKEIRLERDDDAVTITTHHNSKGLEYEVVFLPYLWSLSQRDFQKQDTVLARTDNGVIYDLGSDEQADFERLRQVDNLAEHIRKAYVTLTRARQRCYIVWGPVTSSRKRVEALAGLGYLLSGHPAPSDGSLADHVQAARRLAAGPGVMQAIRALDPDQDVMAIVEPPAPTGEPLPVVVQPEVTLAARTLDTWGDGRGRQRADDAWRRASFSAWSRGSHQASAELAASDETDTETARTETLPVGLHAFAAGTGPGTCLHGVLQHADWRDEPEAVVRNKETIAQHLQTYGLDARRRHRAPLDPVAEVQAMLVRVRDAPLFRDADEAPLAIGQAEARLAEWPFAVPLGRVAPRDLADAFRQHGAEPFAADYADALASLSRPAIDGLMVGEVDLVALAGDRWWIVDWKSNRLGDDATAYAPDALAATMRGHHYGLQLHLYVYGLHRYLRSRLGDAYDYGTHIGGATYAFLRGMEGGGEAGLFTHRPSAQLVDALDQLLAPDA